MRVVTATTLKLEEARLEALRSLRVLDSLPETEFDGVVRIAAEILGTPIALISLVDEDRQWFKAKVGLEVCETSRDVSFCAHAILQTEPLVVPDATLDPRFADNPLVAGEFGLRFYVGVPILYDGHPIGTVCGIDRRPRNPTAGQIEALVALAGQVAALLRARLRARTIERTNAELQRRERELADALAEAERAKEAAWTSSVRFEQLFAGLPIACFTYDETATIQEWNGAAEALWGIPASKAFLQSIYGTAVGEANRAAKEETVRRVFAGETVSGVERLETMRDGSQRWILSNTFPLRRPSGAIVGAVSANVDVTERKRMEESIRGSEERLRTVLDSLHEGVILQGPAGETLLWNESAERTLGITGEDLQGGTARFAEWRTCREDGSELPAEERPAARARRGGRANESVMGIYRADGELRWVSVHAAPIAMPDGAEGAVVASFVDVTERRRMEGSLLASEERLRTVVESLHEGLMVQDAEGQVLLWNPSARRTFGLDITGTNAREGRGTVWRILREDGTDYPTEEQPIATALRTGATQTGAVMGVQFGDEAVRWLSVNASPLRRDGVESATEAVSSFVDITERLAQERRIEAYARELEAANRRLESLATTDGLTGLKNHRYFQDFFRRKIEQCAAAGFPLSVALLDVDRFKSYNDDFGHQAGDAVLRGVAEVLERSVRSTDLVARYGGEEFVIVMPGLDEEGARAMAERVRARLEAAPFELRAVTASFGVATLAPPLSDAEGMVRAADEALYRSKAAGRNRVTLWTAAGLAPA